MEHGVHAVLGGLVVLLGAAFQGAAVSQFGAQGGVAGLRVDVQGPGVQQVADPQDHLDAVQRFGEEVGGSGMKGPVARLAGHVGGQDEHRQERVGGQGLLQFVEDVEAVAGGHVQVEQQQVGVDLQAPWDGVAGVGDAVDLQNTDRPQDPVEQRHVGRFVIDDHHVGVVEDVGEQRDVLDDG